MQHCNIVVCLQLLKFTPPAFNNEIICKKFGEKIKHTNQLGLNLFTKTCLQRIRFPSNLSKFDNSSITSAN